MKSAAYVLLTVLCTMLFCAASLAAAEVHGGFAVIAVAFFAGAVASLMLAVEA
jgi:hypothetical protein